MEDAHVTKRQKRICVAETVLYNRDILSSISKLLLGEHVLAVFPLVCRSLYSMRYSLHLLDPCSSERDHGWTEHRLEYPIPSRHSLLSLKVRQESLDFKWLEQRAPDLESLVIISPLNNVLDPRFQLPNLPRLKTLDLQTPGWAVNDLSKYPNLTRVALSRHSGEEYQALKALWFSPLVSLTLSFPPKFFSTRSEEELQPPRFAETLRELICGDIVTVALTPFCRSLEVLSCPDPGHLVIQNPQLTSLTITRCVKSHLALYRLHPQLQRLAVNFHEGDRVRGSLGGTINGACPNLLHVELGNVNSSAMESFLWDTPNLLTAILKCQWDQFVRVAGTAIQPGKCKVFWRPTAWDDVDPAWDDLIQLINRGILLDESLIARGIESRVLESEKDLSVIAPYLGQCTTLNADKMTDDMFRGGRTVFDLFTSLTSLNSILKPLSGQHNIHFESRTVRKITIRNTITPLSIQFKTPNLQSLFIHCVMDVPTRQLETFLQYVLDGQGDKELPHLRTLELVCDKSLGDDPSLQCISGHRQLRELTCFGLSLRVIHLKNLPNLRKAHIPSPDCYQFVVNLPAWCDVYIGLYSLRPAFSHFPMSVLI